MGVTCPLQAAAVREVKIDAAYLASGEKTAGSVTVDMQAPAPAGAKLRVMEFRRADIPAAAGAKAGETSRVVLERLLAELHGPVSFELDAVGSLTGGLRVSAEIIAPDQA